MRVIAGKLRGMKLDYPKKEILRPTQDRVKEALFSIIQSQIEGAVCLDCCAGTGSLGIEALSRGASWVDCIDINTKTLQKNIEKSQSKMSEGKIEWANVPIKPFIKKAEKKYDIVFLDPPWDKRFLYDDTLKAICDFDILSEAGLVVCEHPKDCKMKDFPGLKRGDSYAYGQTTLTLYRYDS